MSARGGRPGADVAEALGRIDSIDILRGLVMVVMALDHTREYFHLAVPGIDATDPLRSNVPLYATRWITYFCAPTFVFLSGVSAWLRGARSPEARARLASFLASRGLWLLLVELTLVGTAFTFRPGYLFLQVIWVIGAGFLALALLCRLPTRAVLAVGAAIVAGHGLLDWLSPRPIAQAAGILDFLDGRLAFINAGPFHGVLLYSALGWLGIMLCGYGAGPLFRLERRRRDRALALAGLGLIAAFMLLRLANGYGDPSPWAAGPSLGATVMSFLRVTKYPPSLDFTLATLGPMLVLLSVLSSARGSGAAVLRTYGRVPFFYYLLHIYLIHGCAALAGMAMGLPFAAFTDPLNPPREFGVPLWAVYCLWLLFVATLYLPCRWFERLRQRRSDWWLSYL